MAYDYMAERPINKCKVCGKPCPDHRTVCWICDKNVDALIEYNKKQDCLYSKNTEPEEDHVNEFECEECKIPPLDEEMNRHSGLLEEE